MPGGGREVRGRGRGRGRRRRRARSGRGFVRFGPLARAVDRGHLIVVRKSVRHRTVRVREHVAHGRQERLGGRRETPIDLVVRDGRSAIRGGGPPRQGGPGIAAGGRRGLRGRRGRGGRGQASTCA